MATITLDDKHRLESDSRQWSLQKKGISKGQVVWSSIRHYTTIKAAVNGCYQHFLKSSDADGVIELMKAQQDILNKLTEALSPQYNVTEA